jgi:uncharacterized protein (DUF58 family)
MDDAGPSLTKRVIAALVLLVVAVLAIRLVLGVISAIFWIVALVVLVIAALWAMTTLRAAKRDRVEKRASKRGRSVAPAPSRQVQAAPHDDAVEQEMRKLREQLRDQGRL